MIGAIGLLLCALGTPRIYYGTEQGFTGSGDDNQMREAMFDKAPGGKSHLNAECLIYREIAKIADVMRRHEPLRFGRMYYRQIANESPSFGFPFGSTYTLAFSRLLYGQEILIAYNVSGNARQDRVIVDATLHPHPSQLTYLYGKSGALPVQTAPSGARFVQIDLDPHQFAILA